MRKNNVIILVCMALILGLGGLASAAPPVTTGLVLQWDATNIDGAGNAMADGARLLTLKDLSGTGHDGTLTANGTAATGAVHVKSNPDFGGLSTVHFDLNDGSTQSYDFPEIVNIRTVFWVVTRDAGKFYPLGHTTWGGGYGWHGGDGNGMILAYQGYPQNVLDVTGVWRKSGVIVDPTTTPLGAEGALVSVVTGGDALANFFSGDGRSSKTGYPDRGLDGHLCELLIYTAALTEAEVAQVGEYLATKWDVTGYLNWDPINPPVTTFSPADGEVDVSVGTGNAFFLHDGVNTVGYRLYLKEGSAPGAGDMVTEGDPSINQFSLLGLVEAEKTYYWYVEAWNPVYTVQSDTMSFTTAADTGGGSGPPLPAVNAGLRLHLDATDIDGKGDGATGDPADGTQFAVWADKSGNGYDFPQMTGRTSPTIELDGLNGRPSVWFVNNTVLERTDSLGFLGNPGMSIILVMNALRNDSIMSVGPGPRESGTVASSKILNTHSRFYFNTGNELFANNPSFGKGPMIAEFANPIDATFSQHVFFDNGVPAARTGGAGGNDTMNIKDENMVIGAGRANNGNVNNQFQGHMSEILIYDNELSGGDRAAVNAYLVDKWGLGIPSVAILSPGSGNVVLPGSLVTISAAASDVFGGSIKQVEFFINGVSIGIETDVDAFGEYSIEWMTTTTLGTTYVSAFATDNDLPAPVMVGDTNMIEIAAPLFVMPTGSGDGTSWATSAKLTSAVVTLNAAGGGSILAQSGTYVVPYMTLSQGIDIYGACAGTESLPTDRTGAAAATILDGGGINQIIYITGNNVILDSLQMQNGLSADEGGAMNIAEGPATIVNCSFINNHAASDPTVWWQGGGAISIWGGGGAAQKVIIDNCTFSGNSSLNRGGAISHYYANDVYLLGCTFTNNTAATGGGYCEASNGSRGFIDGCLFENNTATINGGAVGTFPNTEPLITNSVFKNNTATELGGAIGLSGTDAAIFNNTFIGNTSTNTAADCIHQIQDAARETWVVNNVFTGVAGLAVSTDIDPVNVHLVNNLLDGATLGTGAGPNGTMDGMVASGNLTVAPVFASATDYSPTAASPQVDAGDATSLPTGAGFRSYPDSDFDGKARWDGAPDVGAFELLEGGIALSPSELNFGFDSTAGVTTSLTLTVTSIGNMSVDVQSATITGNPSSAVVFATVGDTDPFSPIPTLAVGETLDIVVEMTPAKAGVNYAGQIHVLTVGEASALTTDLIGGTGGAPTSVRGSWLLYETK